MQRAILRWSLECLLAFFVLFSSPAAQLISISNTAQPVGTGDSMAPMITLDGRFVLFDSAAPNLLLATNGNPLSSLPLLKMNVFLRDRTNAITQLISVNLTGVSGGNGDSIAIGISTNNRFVLFESSATDLLVNATNAFRQVFLRDLASNSTTLVSISLNGIAGDGDCRSSTMTPDGRYVAFVSDAADLVAGDTNAIADVFVRDLQTGTTTLASPGAIGSSLFKPFSESPEITPDGRYVAFYSTATNLLPGLSVQGDIFVRDMAPGTTTWASTGARAALLSALGTTNAVSYNHQISADGQYVIFQSSLAPNSNNTGTNGIGIVLRYNVGSGTTEVINTNAFVTAANPEFIRSLDVTTDGRFVAFVGNTNDNFGSNTCIYLWDGFTGTTTLLSGDSNNVVTPNSVSQRPLFDPTGRFLTFSSTATNLTTNTLVGEYHLYLRDIQAGTTTLIDADPNGVSSPISPGAVASPDTEARFIAFESQDGNLAFDDRNNAADIFVRYVMPNTTELISAVEPTLTSVTPAGWSVQGPASVSADGNRIVFSSDAPDLGATDNNHVRNIFVRDLAAGITMPVSVATNGALGDYSSLDASISADGRFVAFTSTADNLVANDVNRSADVFLTDLQSGTTRLISVTTNGTVSTFRTTASVINPIISSDGTRVTFASQALNLAPVISSGTAGFGNLFQRDLNSGMTYALTTHGLAGPVNPAASRGRFIFFAGSSPNAVYLWDAQAHANVYTNSSASSFSSLAASPDGNHLVYVTASQLRAVDRAANTNWAIGPAVPTFLSQPQFSDDGRFLVYLAASGLSVYQVYLYDFQTGVKTLLTQSFYDTGAGNGHSDSQMISPDGRFVAYRSIASNLVLNDNNGAPDVFLYDRVSATTTMVSASGFANRPANNRSEAPVFSPDSRTLLFRSWASDFVANDFNQSGDIFSLNLYPSNSIAPFAIEVLPVAGSKPVLSWQAVAGRTYAVQFKNDLSDPSWQPGSGELSIIGSRAYYTETAPALQRFYRVIADENTPP